MIFLVLRSLISYLPLLRVTGSLLSQAMLYAAGVPDKHTMKTAPHVGIASVWWEGNPCNMHLLGLGKEVKKAITNLGMLGWQYNTIGVSDGITMGGEGLLFWNTLADRQLNISRHEVLSSNSRDHRRQYRDRHLRPVP
jgi:dihydroxyacid dehydratase/phosphogluconate dehydratase